MGHFGAVLALCGFAGIAGLLIYGAWVSGGAVGAILAASVIAIVVGAVMMKASHQ